MDLSIVFFLSTLFSYNFELSQQTYASLSIQTKDVCIDDIHIQCVYEYAHTYTERDMGRDRAMHIYLHTCSPEKTV